MSFWGESWGSDDVVDTSIRRLLQSVRQGPNFRRLVQIFAERAKGLIVATEAIRAAFDLDDAVGVQLDRLGEILQRRRLGLSDERYRIVLKIQVLLILSSTATTSTIIEMLSRFGTPAQFYAEHYPMGFSVGAVVPASQTSLLKSLLSDARAACYNGTLHALDDDWLRAEYIPDDPAGPVSTVEVVGRDFDGVDDGITWSSPLNLGAFDVPFSLALWVRPSALDTNNEYFLIINTDVWLSSHVNGRIRFFVDRATSVLNRVTDGGFLTSGEWAHVVVTYDGSLTGAGVRIFVNGSEATYAATDDGAGAVNTLSGDWVWGGTGGFRLGGVYTQPRVWDHVLTPTEVWAEYRSPGGPAKTSGLLWAPPMDTLVDPISGLVGTATGTAQVDAVLPDIDTADYHPGDPLPAPGGEPASYPIKF